MTIGLHGHNRLSTGNNHITGIMCYKTAYKLRNLVQSVTWVALAFNFVMTENLNDRITENLDE